LQIVTNNIERQPKGRSTGGQFAKSKNPESTVDLTQESTPEEQKVAFKQRGLRYPRHSTADDEWSRFFRNSEGDDLG
jgi:hypothetical protein